MSIAERVIQPGPERTPPRTPIRLGGRAATRTADGRLARVGDRVATPPVPIAVPVPVPVPVSAAEAEPVRLRGRARPIAPVPAAPAAPQGPPARRSRRRTIRTRRPGVTRPTSAGLRAHRPAGPDGRGTARAERIAAIGPREVPRALAELELQPHPALRLVPRRRRAARYAAVLSALVVSTMLAAASFQTQLAERQVQLDQLDRDIRGAREEYDRLRRERAELRSPSRLSEIASEMGMVTATDTGFMVMSPEVLAEVQVSTGSLDDDSAADDPLEQFRDVKSITDGAP